MMKTISPGPARIQIQTQSGCNGRCVFCPLHETLKARLPQGRMTEPLFQKIVDELAELNPRRISPYLMNEPLLDNRLPRFVQYITERAPRATTLITSNGTHINEPLAEALLDAGLKRLKVSLQSIDPVTNEKLMGSWCDSRKIIENVLLMKRIADKKRARHFDLRVSTVVTRLNADQIDDARRFWAKHNIRLVTSSLENRGGNIADAGDLNPHEMTARNNGCLRPSRDMCILFNGDAVLCCVDWFRTQILGNVGEQSVRKVWNGPKIEAVRRALETNDTGAMPEICANCTESACPQHHRRGLRGFLSRLFAS